MTDHLHAANVGKTYFTISYQQHCFTPFSFSLWFPVILSDKCMCVQLVTGRVVGNVSFFDERYG